MATVVVYGRSSSVAAVNGILDHFDRCNTGAFCDLLPVGAMWPRATDTVLYQTCSAYSIELGRVDRQITKLLSESYPDTTQEMLSGWERNCGLPNTCEEEHGPCAAVPTGNLVFMASPIALDSYPGSGTDVINIAPLGGQVGSFTGGTTVAAERFQFDGTSGAVEWSTFGAVEDIFDGATATVVVVGMTIDAAGGFGGGVISKTDGSSGWSVGVGNEMAGEVDVALFVRMTGTDGVWQVQGAPIVDVETSVAWSWSGSGSAQCWIAGVPQTVVETSTPTGTYATDVAEPLRLGNANIGDRTFDGSQGMSLIYRRALTDAEHFAINAVTEDAGGILDSLPQRQQNVVNVIAQDHVLNDEFWAELARGCGYQPPVIEKNTAFCVGQDCTTDPVCGVDALLSVTFTFTSGVNDELLECKIREFWPEYVTLFVVFT